MKSNFNFRPNHIILAGCVGFILTLGAFWDYSRNQKSLELFSRTSEGISTCWSRISQTFTALMIKEVQSPYLNRGFMAISDECFGEVVKDSSDLKKFMGKNFETFPSLISDVNWFHEDVLKVHGPMMSGKNIVPADKVLERYTKIESLKLKATDDLEMVVRNLRTISGHDKIIIGAGLFFIVLSISMLGLTTFYQHNFRTNLENEALNLLSSGQAKTGALIDTIVIKGLRFNGLKVTEQIFRDYHENILEILSAKQILQEKNSDLKSKDVTPERIEKVIEVQEQEVQLSKSSLKEILVSIENLHSESDLQIADFRDAIVEVEGDACAQLFNSAITKLKEKRIGQKRIMLANQIHSDRVIVNFYLAGSTFHSSELEFFEHDSKGVFESLDMNLMVLKELALESNVKLGIENKMDKNGKISGLSLKLIFKRVSKDKSKLVNVVKGKKKDLSKSLVVSH